MFDILLKQMGIDPDNIKKQVAETHKVAVAVYNHFNNRLDIIQKQNQIIIAALQVENDSVTLLNQHIEKVASHNPLTQEKEHE